ncbi:MAG: CBASS cGAMP synthase, partial [Pseudomonadota bacterium]
VDQFAAKPLTLRPLFFTQGSYAYRTWNSPAHRPPQHIDLDDGMYLPLSVFENADSPKLASAALFAGVDAMLGELCRAQGWNLIRDKKTCCRIDLTTGAHIDIPLYAIPDGDVRLLEARAASYKYMTEHGQIALARAFDSQPEDFRLSSDKVWLAHRTKGWHQSDPRQLHDWFELKARLYGDQLRRVCRYVKAWRDWYEKDSPLSSIALMAHVVAVFEDQNQDRQRDDLMLLAVAERLPTLLRDPVPNPTNPGQMLDDSLSDAQRQRAVDAAAEWHRNLDRAMGQVFDTQRVVKILMASFGPRMPNRPDLVSIEGGEETVMSVAPAVLPTREIPNRSVSG